MNFYRAMICLLGLLPVFGPVPARAAGVERMEYDITWVGVSIGTMVIQSETNAAGHLVRSLRMWNRPWIAVVYPVDTSVECEYDQTADGPRHTIHKKVRENDFRQDDTLIIWPDLGKAVWTNSVAQTVSTSSVPVGSRDLVSFFFDLRDAIVGGPLKVGGPYQMVMDGRIHDLEIRVGEPKKIRTPFGRLEAIPVDAESHSPTLFSRNRPKSVWVALSKPAVLSADVESRFGPVRSTLVKWTQDGIPVSFGSGKP